MRLITALLSAAMLPLAARAAFHSNDTACTRHYTVQDGDTCDKIGQKTLTSTYQILAFNLLNAGSACYTLEIGAQLCLGRYGNDCQFVHQCTDQDTCESIASAYGITTHRLQDNNPSLDCDVVYEGLMLCVSAGSIRPPADKSINATDVMIEREQARQAYLVQQRAKEPTAEAKTATSHHKHSTSEQQHTGHHKQHQHHQKHVAKHSHDSSKDGKAKADEKADSHQDVAKPEAHLPHPAPEHTSSKHADESQQQQHHQDHDVEHGHKTHTEPTNPPSPSSHDQPEASITPDHLEQHLIEDLLLSSTSSAVSNHTPSGAANSSPLRRHRSLSSRSHHQRSQTP